MNQSSINISYIEKLQISSGFGILVSDILRENWAMKIQIIITFNKNLFFLKEKFLLILYIDKEI
jgi:hypothetical protein